MSPDKMSDLLLRWNKAASKICAGSEYIDEPELVFDRIRQQLNLAKELGRKLGQQQNANPST